MEPIKQLKSVMICATSAFLIACGGGGGGSSLGSSSGTTFSGNTAPAQIDQDNAQSIGEASGEAVGQAASSASLPTAIELDITDLAPLHQAVIETAKLSTLPTGIDVSREVCTGGGTANVTLSGPAATSGMGRLDSVIIYGNCTITSGFSSFTINGRVETSTSDFSSSTSSFSISYQNVTVSGFGIGSQTLNYTFSCTNASNINTCTTSSVFTSTSGTHEIRDYSINGTSSLGYNGSASFSHETYGTVSITISGITYGNCGSAPDGGSISFSSTNGTSGSISFASNCTVSGTWNNGTTSGSF